MLPLQVSLTSSENNKKTVTKRTIIMRIVTNASKFSPKSSRCASDIYRSKPSAACSSLLPSCLATILSAIEMVVNSEAALRCALRRVDNHLHGRYPLNKQKRRIMRLWRLLIKGIGVNRWFPFKRKARVLSLTLSTVWEPAIAGSWVLFVDGDAGLG